MRQQEGEQAGANHRQLSEFNGQNIFPKLPYSESMGCERRVLLAFSGGNDSCAAVGILRAQGYEPTLLTLDMTGDRSLLARARRAAEALDTPLLTK